MQQNFNPGDTVVIINSKMGGTAMIEGWATIIRATNLSDDHYLVQFSKGGDTYERFVDPDAQADPEAFVNKLNMEARFE